MDTLALPQAQARADAALALGNLGKEEAMAIPKLTELLRYDHAVADGVFVRDAAVKALGDMGSEAASSVVQIFDGVQRSSTRRFRGLCLGAYRPRNPGSRVARSEGETAKIVLGHSLGCRRNLWFAGREGSRTGAAVAPSCQKR